MLPFREAPSATAWPGLLPRRTSPPLPCAQLLTPTISPKAGTSPGPYLRAFAQQLPFYALAQLLLLGTWGTALLDTSYRKISLGVCLISPRALELACLDLNPSSTSYEALCPRFPIGKIETVVGLSSECARCANTDPGTSNT